MRLGWYAGVSTALAGSVVLSAFNQRPNFYSAMVHLSQSNFCLLVLVNFTFLVYSSFFYGLTRLCFGRLRAVETEQLTERAWFAVTETCLAMTIFREEIGGWFLVMFTALLTGKVWGWIGDGRVEILEQQPPANPRLFHARLSISLTMSCVYAMWILQYSVNTVVQQARPSMMVMFLFEFAVLTTSSWRTGARYVLSLTEQNIITKQTTKRLHERRLEVRQQREATLRQRAEAAANGDEPPENEEPLPSEDDIEEMDIEVPGWAAKGEYVLWLDLVTDALKLGIYVAFFGMLVWQYGLPIHIMRDLFMTARDFVKRMNALLRYRRAMREMNRHPDATEEDLARDSTCIICREEMRPWDAADNPGALDRVRPKKLPCGHILHLGCLKSWLERQQVCPTCRTPVTRDAGRAALNRADQRVPAGGQPVPQPQGQAQPAPPGVDNAPPGDRPNMPQQPAEPANRARVFNIGPIRLGFGANAQQIRELAQQFGRVQGVNQGQVAPVATPQPQQQPQQPPLQGDNIQNIGSLLQQAEQMVQRELQSLQNTQQELQTIHLLMAELQRLRQRQQHQDQGLNGHPHPVMPVGFPPAAPFPMNSHTAVSFQGNAHLVPPFMGPLPHPAQRMGAPLMARHGTAPIAAAIPSGSPDLPDGVVIPPGWSLTPLQMLDDHQPLPPFNAAPVAMRANGEARPANGSAHPTSVEPSSREVSNGDVPPPEPVPTPTTTSVPALSDATEPAERSAPVEAAPAEAAPMVAPSPIMPNWGGQAQLYNGSSPLEHGTGAAQDSNAESGAETGEAQEQAEAKGKGKGKAATVEEAQDDDDGQD